MCPLRYVILAVSAVVALLLMMYGQSETKDPLAVDDGQSITKEGEETSETAKEGEKPKTRPLDFITGRYLYNVWKDFRGQRGAALSAEPAPKVH